MKEQRKIERVFSAISHSSSYGDVITSNHCSVIGLNRIIMLLRVMVVVKMTKKAV